MKEVYERVKNCDDPFRLVQPLILWTTENCLWMEKNKKNKMMIDKKN